LNILVNAIGIVDSGGMVVFEKFLDECQKNNSDNKVIVLLSKNKKIDKIKKKYHKVNFITIFFSNYITRLIYENFYLRKIIANEKIELIYNFSGSKQFFIKTPQLIKVHNLLFYSKKLDKYYLDSYGYVLWIKHIFIKRLFFKLILRHSRFIEIQSSHVRSNLSDFIKLNGKNFFIKSDICCEESDFNKIKNYDLTKKISFLYICGPHFDYPHKNLNDFVKAMMKLKDRDLNFEINITIDRNDLHNSPYWNRSLDSLTNFYGYIDHKILQKKLFNDNTILVSTSVIETVGLHVIEAIQNGVLTITPNEPYGDAVYGFRRFKYNLFDSDSLVNTILNILSSNINVEEILNNQQEYVMSNEKTKYNDVLKILSEVANV
jgi:glycosyltransferase involved in cell wall biosynthesis